MEAEPKTPEGFTINVDVTDNGIPSELDVIPGMTDYVILLDGVELTRIQFDLSPPERWVQLDGNLDQNLINSIGEAIDKYEA